MRVKRPLARLALVLIALVAVAFPVAVVFADVPASAARYRGDLTREARRVWGLDAPVSDFAAQIHQESGWNPTAVSRAGAQGMAQFMPATARWWCEINGLTPAECQPHQPTWAIRALIGYDRWLWDRLPHHEACQRQRDTLRAYNGGLGYVQRERRTGQPCRAFRAAWACTENLAYPTRILDTLAPRYAAAGWGASACGGAHAVQ